MTHIRVRALLETEKLKNLKPSKDRQIEQNL